MPEIYQTDLELINESHHGKQDLKAFYTLDLLAPNPFIIMPSK
jgi:hypothetical protein